MVVNFDTLLIQVIHKHAFFIEINVTCTTQPISIYSQYIFRIHVQVKYLKKNKKKNHKQSLFNIKFFIIKIKNDHAWLDIDLLFSQGHLNNFYLMLVTKPFNVTYLMYIYLSEYMIPFEIRKKHLAKTCKL